MPRISSLAGGTLRRDKSSYFAVGLAVSAALAATALWMRRSARRAEDRHPPAGKFIEVDGVRLHYVEYGVGEPVVLLHGNGAASQDFVGSRLAGELAQRYRVVAFDRPGFGYSERPRSHVWTPNAQARLLQVAMTRLRIQRPVVIGHSWGTLVALAMAQRDPDAVRGLLLVSGYYYPTLRLDAVVQSPSALPLLGDVLRYTILPLLGRVITPLQVRYLFAPQPVPESFWTHTPLEMMLRPWQLRAAAADSALLVPAAAALTKHYGEIRVPTTIVAGTEDHMASYHRHSARLHRDLPLGNLMLLPGVGHMLHYAAPEQLAAAVDDLFALGQPLAHPHRPLAEPAVTTPVQ